MYTLDVEIGTTGHFRHLVQYNVWFWSFTFGRQTVIFRTF